MKLKMTKASSVRTESSSKELLTFSSAFMDSEAFDPFQSYSPKCNYQGRSYLIFWFD